MASNSQLTNNVNKMQDSKRLALVKIVKIDLNKEGDRGLEYSPACISTSTNFGDESPIEGIHIQLLGTLTY